MSIFDFKDKLIENLQKSQFLSVGLKSSFILFSIIVLTVSFGVAATSIASLILFFFSVIFLIVEKQKILIVETEKYFLFLVIWLAARAGFSNNIAESVVVILEEFRILIFLPIVSTAIAYLKIDHRRLIYMVLLVGISFNVIGNNLLIFGNAYKLDIARWLVFFLEIPVVDGGKPYSIDGKFVQAWIMTLWGAMTAGALLTQCGLYTRLWLIIIFFGGIYHSYFIGALSALLGLIFSATLLVMLLRNYRFLLNIFVAFPLFLFIFLTFLSIDLETSLGSRVSSWVALYLLPSQAILVGYGSEWVDFMRGAQEIGILSAHNFEWRDFHSDVVWIFVLGGVVGAGIFILAVRSFIDYSFSKFKFINVDMGLFLLPGCIAVFMLSIFNSNLLAIKESHIFFLALLVIFILEKTAHTSEGIVN